MPGAPRALRPRRARAIGCVASASRATWLLCMSRSGTRRAVRAPGWRLLSTSSHLALRGSRGSSCSLASCSASQSLAQWKWLLLISAGSLAPTTTTTRSSSPTLKSRRRGHPRGGGCRGRGSAAEQSWAWRCELLWPAHMRAARTPCDASAHCGPSTRAVSFSVRGPRRAARCWPPRGGCDWRRRHCCKFGGHFSRSGGYNSIAGSWHACPSFGCCSPHSRGGHILPEGLAPPTRWSSSSCSRSQRFSPYH
mmetsp:Transcript_42994/g.106041  ORF Transcript_42994/g.106041 Transcript_42994/m.106041 type:complete len:251 (+) Transcript_42994:98-850(+)